MRETRIRLISKRKKTALVSFNFKIFCMNLKSKREAISCFLLSPHNPWGSTKTPPEKHAAYSNRARYVPKKRFLLFFMIYIVSPFYQSFTSGPSFYENVWNTIIACVIIINLYYYIILVQYLRRCAISCSWSRKDDFG